MLKIEKEANNEEMVTILIEENISVVELTKHFIGLFSLAKNNEDIACALETAKAYSENHVDTHKDNKQPSKEYLN